MCRGITENAQDSALSTIANTILFEKSSSGGAPMNKKWIWVIAALVLVGSNWAAFKSLIFPDYG